MEENKKPIKVKLHTFIIIIAIAVIIMLAIFIYIQKSNSDKTIKQLQSEAAQLQDTSNELQGKLNDIARITNSNKNDNTNTTNTTSSKETNNTSSSNTSTNKSETVNNVVGTWKVQKVYDKGVEESDWRVIFGSAGTGAGLILKSDKTFKDEVGITISSEENSTEGTYEVNGNNVILKFSNGATKTLTYDSKSETLDFPNYMADCRLILKK